MDNRQTMEDVRTCTRIENGRLVTSKVADIREGDNLLPYSVRLYDITDRTIPAEEGTHPSPIISWGEELDPEEIWNNAQEIPF